MPQPFDPETPHQLRADAFTQRPALAVHVATIAAVWSATEAFQGNILAHLIRGDVAAAAALYTAMTSNVAQRTAIKAVAESRQLEQPVLDELEAVLDEVKSRAKERNAVVHALWGISERHPDALVNCTIQSWIHLEANTQDLDRNPFYTGIPADGDWEEAFKHISISRLKMTLYKEGDFKAIISRIEALNKRMFLLQRVLKPARYQHEVLLRRDPSPQSGS